MITPLGSVGSAVGTAKVSGVTRPAAVGGATAVRGGGVYAPTPAADMAALGPPVDMSKVDRIRSAIANGSYTLDVQAIAARMVDMDLPPA